MAHRLSVLLSRIQTKLLSALAQSPHREYVYCYGQLMIHLKVSNSLVYSHHCLVPPCKAKGLILMDPHPHQLAIPMQGRCFDSSVGSTNLPHIILGCLHKPMHKHMGVPSHFQGGNPTNKAIPISLWCAPLDRRIKQTCLTDSIHE